MKKFLNNCIQIIFISLILLMIVSSIVTVNIYKIGSIAICLLGILILLYLYKKGKISNRLVGFVALLMIVLGLIIRLRFIFNLNFSVSSDFKLYYDTALSILNKTVLEDAHYLSYNGYVYIFSTVLATFMKIFGSGIEIPLCFNLLCQIGTVYLIVKFSNKYIGSKWSLFLGGLWFILPNVIEANLLVSTETLFIFLLMLIIYLYYNWLQNKNSKFSILKYILFGILLGFSNNIRPVIIIFIIALIIDSLVNYREIKYLLLLTISIISFVGVNKLSNLYVEKSIGEPTRSGALTWSLYFGSNFEYNGMWNIEDSNYSLSLLDTPRGNEKLLKDVINRYKDMGVINTLKLYSKKYIYLWSDINGNYEFLVTQIDGKPIRHLGGILNCLSLIPMIIIWMFNIWKSAKDLKTNNNEMILIKLFAIGYILSNLLIVVNGRYNYPMLLLLIILLANLNKRKQILLL